MGVCNCNNNDQIQLSKNYYDLAEAMEDENRRLDRDINHPNFTSKQRKNVSLFINESQELISILRSIPNSKVYSDDIEKIKEIVNNCYSSLLTNDTTLYTNSRKELKYYISIKLVHDLGVSVY